MGTSSAGARVGMLLLLVATFFLASCSQSVFSTTITYRGTTVDGVNSSTIVEKIRIISQEKQGTCVEQSDSRIFLSCVIEIENGSVVLSPS